MNNLKTNNYWLIPMDFSTCNYEQLQKEWKETNKIMWQVPGTPKKKDDTWKKPRSTSMVNSLKKGDVIYFYVTNLPSNSKNNILSRVMLRGQIKDEPHPIEKNKVYFDSNETNLIYGFSIESLTTLPKEQLENNSFLSLAHLNTIDRNFTYPQGRRWPDKNIKKSLSENIVNRLEGCFKSTMRKYDFESLINHFNKKCFFCGKYGTKNDHKTFIGRNGLDYFEYHHFIPQAKAKDFPKLQEIIDNSTNGLFLCSNCHNKMHYGAVTEVRDMLEIVLKDTQIQKMLTDFNFQKNIGEENDVFEWFQEAYKIKEHK